MTTQLWSLLEVCSFCFEKNEVLYGWGRRDVPYQTEALAREAFAHLVEEACLLYGQPRELSCTSNARAREWAGKLRIGVSGRLVRVFVAAAGAASPASSWGDADPDWEGIADEDWTVLE